MAAPVEDPPWIPFVLGFHSKPLDKASPPWHSDTSSHSGLPAVLSVCQARSCLRTFARTVLLLKEFLLQTLACLAPSCPLTLNPDVTFSDHPYQVPEGSPLIIVYLIPLVSFFFIFFRALNN